MIVWCSAINHVCWSPVDAARWFMCGPSTFSSSSGMHPASERAEAAQTMLCTDHDPQKILPGVRLDDLDEDTAGIAWNCWFSGQVVEDRATEVETLKRLENIGSDDLRYLKDAKGFKGPDFQPSPRTIDSWHTLPCICTNLLASCDFWQRGLLSAAAWRGEARIKSQSQH